MAFALLPFEWHSGFFRLTFRLSPRSRSFVEQNAVEHWIRPLSQSLALLMARSWWSPFRDKRDWSPNARPYSGRTGSFLSTAACRTFALQWTHYSCPACCRIIKISYLVEVWPKWACSGELVVHGPLLVQTLDALTASYSDPHTAGIPLPATSRTQVNTRAGNPCGGRPASNCKIWNKLFKYLPILCQQ